MQKAKQYSSQRYDYQSRLLIPPETKNIFTQVFQWFNDELGRDVLKLMAKRYGNNRNLRVSIPEKDGMPMQGSNVYIKFAVIPLIRELTNWYVRFLTPALSEQALRSDVSPYSASTYEDLGVGIFNLEKQNSQLANHLINQAREAGVKIEFPMVFPYLKTAKDDKFPDGLRLDLYSDAPIDDHGIAYHEPSLMLDGIFGSNDPKLIVTGFPSIVGKRGLFSNRTLSTFREGLVRIYREAANNQNLGANVHGLTDSAEHGRVSFLVGADPQNFAALEERVMGAVMEIFLGRRMPKL